MRRFTKDRHCDSAMPLMLCHGKTSRANAALKSVCLRM